MAKGDLIRNAVEAMIVVGKDVIPVKILFSLFLTPLSLFVYLTIIFFNVFCYIFPNVNICLRSVECLVI
jgi:hypothetical protein